MGIAKQPYKINLKGCSMEEGVKIYGLCLERMRYQIGNAKKKAPSTVPEEQGRFLLESYNTKDIDDIIDILELYDIESKSFEHLRVKLEELAYTVSVLTREIISFGFTDEGHLGLYLTLNAESGEAVEEDIALAAIA